MKEQKRKEPGPPSLSATRERLALALILLFAIVSLTAVFVPDAGAARHLVPFVASLLVLVVRFYFKQGEGE
jgi:hypothetical protein